MASMSGKVALITGGTSGIGRAAAVAFGQAGASVVVTGRREAMGQETVKLVEATGAKALYVRADAASEGDNQAMVEATLQHFSRLDYAFNNAGLDQSFTPLQDNTVAEYHRIMDVNVLGVLLAMKYEIPALRKTGGGAIVNTTSIAGVVGLGMIPIYVASKHAVIGLTKTVALEVAKENIRVNAVAPAAIETEMFTRFAGAPDSDIAKTVAAMHPVGHMGQPREIADPVVFLCSDAASFITGTTLFVDGGFTAQ